MQPYYFLAVELEVVKELLPLGDALIGAAVTLVTAFITYLIGRAKNKAEVSNLQAEKKSIEAASGVSTAEAAQIISEAAAATVQPLTERIREQREEIKELNATIVELKFQLDSMRNHAARVASENLLMRRKFELQGESIPELPPEE